MCVPMCVSEHVACLHLHAAVSVRARALTRVMHVFVCCTLSKYGYISAFLSDFVG